jgi:hypothetical protein
MFYNIHPLLCINPLCGTVYSFLNFVLSSVLYLSSQSILVLCASLCCILYVLLETLRFTLLCSLSSVRNSAHHSAVFYILFETLRFSHSAITTVCSNSLHRSGLQARFQRLCSTHELRLCWNFKTIYGGLETE